ncbi:bacterial alpha-L-rhamnosidase-domain-containing protein [Halenospora varia]|nr:bacterial alpha-L-rhamnosidase-domain-containing protein [Halenospora varia]
MSISISSLTFSHHPQNSNLGISESSPRISWRFSGTTKNWTQASYELEITPASGVPKTFIVSSEESVLVPWPEDEAKLESREQVSVRVRTTGTDGTRTEWSESVDVEVGLLGREDWTAKMVAGERRVNENGSLRPTLFMKAFQVEKEIKKARLYITAYGVYEASINGEKVGNEVLAPGWTSYKHRLTYETHDVTSLLRKGENGIGVEVADGWYCGRLGFNGGRRFIYGDRLAVLAQLEIEFEDGESVTVGSDESWMSGVGPRISSEIYDGETYDASLESSRGEEKWSAVEILDFPSVLLLAPEGPPIRKVETLKPKEIFRSPSNKVIVDFGQNLVGWVRLHVQGPKGHKITLTHTEVLEHGEVATRPLRDCKAVDSLILSGSPITWEPKFTFHGFRYVQIDNWPSSTGQPIPEDLEGVVIHTDMERTGWFECSESQVNQLHKNITWGMRGNFVGIPTDCPQRDERLGWTGDIQVFAPTANYLYDTSGMLSSWLKDLALEQVKDFKGVVPQVVPNVIDPILNTPQAVWGDVAVITPWTMYNSFGDIEFLKNQYGSMTSWVSAVPRAKDSLLWDPNTHQLGDWLDPSAPPEEPANGKTDPHFIANAYLTYITSLLATISKILEKSSEEQEKYKKEAEELLLEFRNNYITPSGRLAPDTMTSLSLALTFHLFPTTTQSQLAGARLAHLVRASRFRIATGFAGTPLVCPALTMTGHEQIAYRMLLEKRCPSWLYTVSMGATTMWERWDSMLPDGTINPGSMTSFNHYALGAVGEWLHSTVGGISQESSSIGWKVIRFAPVPGGTITWAKTSHLGPYGLISCEWKIEGGRFRMVIQVPPNSRGVVKLPGKTEVIEVGSGEYEDECSWEEDKAWPPKAILDPFSQLQEGDGEL